MKKFGCVALVLSTVISLSALAVVSTPKNNAKDADVVEDTDVYAIPLDESADEENAEISALNKQGNKPKEVKPAEQKKPVSPAPGTSR